MAGGGVQGGQVYGSSDATGAEPKDDPVHAGSIAATMLYALGMRSPQITAPAITRLFA